MNMPKLTKSNEDYLEAIGLLAEKSGTAQVRDIAKMLNVKMPSVTTGVKHLADMGLVQYTQYAPVKLTEKGAQKAKEIIERHATIFRFLSEALQISDERADKIACQMEHIMTAEEIQRLANLTIIHKND